ncbi:MAG: efflux RND transporter periplasmic adaptor subunit [Acidobacteria bacterium]|nr:efflux RND transporter periplasmic adaptor subunit [Acidobacteriota bacterium]
MAIPILAAALLVLGLLAWLRAGDSEEASAAGEVIVVAPRTFSSTVVAVGAVKPRIGSEVRVGSRISGRVWKLRANIGDRVEQGQIIAELETAELDALIAQRRAELKLAEAKLAAFATLSPEEEARARADLMRFEAEVTLTAEELARQQALLERKLAPRAVADAARDRDAVAKAELESARRTLELVRAGHTEGRKQAEADVERARAALESAAVDRSFTVLRSPIAGVIASVATQEGETVAAGLNAPTFVTVVDLERLQVNAYVDEVDIGKIETGQRAAFTVDAFPARDFHGRVAAIYPTATIQDNVVKYIVALDIDGAYAGLLRPEMTASVRIELDARTALTVPVRAVRQDAGRSVVDVVNGDRLEVRPVRVGWRDGPWAEVTDGLVEGERILVKVSVTSGEEQR